MELSLHANAATTPKTRAYIQRSKRSVAELAAELGVSETTIRRWRGRSTVADRPHTPNVLQTSLTAIEERLVCELRISLQLPLDDIVEVLRRCVNASLSRSAIHRCLQRHGISARPKPDKPKPGIFETASIGFIHLDLKHLPALQRHKSYAFVAIDRATRYVYVEVHSRRDGETAAAFLKRFLAHFPHQVHTILTDNGAEFTDRFAVDMKNKPPGRPSGNHPFDRLCTRRGIEHRLTRPYHPQTNGLVERFNRRIAEAIGREDKRGSARRTFTCHADRDAFLSKFVHDYNRTRLKCLGYQAPILALANPPGPNTNAGTRTLRPLGEATKRENLQQQQKPVVMGPRVRGDDERVNSFTRPSSDLSTCARGGPACPSSGGEGRRYYLRQLPAPAPSQARSWSHQGAAARTA
jgi:transposase InsO family protein